MTMVGLHFGYDKNDFDPDEYNKRIEKMLISWRDLRKASTVRLTLGKFNNDLQQHLVPDKDKLLQKNARLMQQLTNIEEEINNKTTYLWVTLEEMKTCLKYERGSQTVRTDDSKRDWKAKVHLHLSPLLDDLNKLVEKERELENNIVVTLDECKSVTGLPLPVPVRPMDQTNKVQ
jgi:hypothetical protein